MRNCIRRRRRERQERMHGGMEKMQTKILRLHRRPLMLSAKAAGLSRLPPPVARPSATTSTMLWERASIKALSRIEKYGFSENIDYVQVVDFIAPRNGGSINSNTYDGAKTAKEYALTLSLTDSHSGEASNELFLNLTPAPPPFSGMNSTPALTSRLALFQPVCEWLQGV